MKVQKVCTGRVVIPVVDNIFNIFCPCFACSWTVKVVFKDVITSISKSDLLSVTMAVIHVAGQ